MNPTLIQSAVHIQEAHAAHRKQVAAIGNRAARRTPEGRARLAEADRQLRVSLLCIHALYDSAPTPSETV